MTTRRGFLATLASGAVASAVPRAASAQRVKRVALLTFMEIEAGDDPKEADRYIDKNYRKPFAELGFREGSNFTLNPHIVNTLSKWEESIPKAIGEIVNGKYDGAIVEGEILARRLQQAAPSLPIAAYLFDPVGQGLAKKLAKPGGTVTGVHRGVREVFSKQIGILQRLVPGTSRMAWISFKPQLEYAWPAFASAAQEAGVSVKQVFLAGGPDKSFPALPADFEMLRREGYRCGHYMGGVGFDLDAVTPLALRHRMALSYWGPPVDLRRDGILLQYRSTREGVEARLCATMARILRGQDPGEIPFEGPTRYQLRINLKTAALIGVNVPDDVLLMMDEVLR